VDVGNVNGLAKRIRELTADTKLLKIMGRAARNHCVKNFSHINMARQYVGVYESKENQYPAT